jgi:hypothetical protein
MVVTLTPEEKKAMDELKGKIYGRTVFDKDFEKALNGKPFVFRYPQKGEPLKQYFDQHGVIIVTNWNNKVIDYWVTGNFPLNK